MQDIPSILVPLLSNQYKESVSFSEPEKIDESSSQVNPNRLKVSLMRGEAIKSRRDIIKVKWNKPQIIKELLIHNSPSSGDIFHNDTESLNIWDTASLWYIKSTDAVTHSTVSESTLADKADFFENYITIIDEVLPINAEHQKLVDDIAAKYFSSLVKKTFPSI